MMYVPFLQILEDEVVYTPASIVSAGEKAGLFRPSHCMFEKELNEVEFKKARIRIRHNFARLKKNHSFPKTGDGIVILKNQAPLLG